MAKQKNKVKDDKSIIALTKNVIKVDDKLNSADTAVRYLKDNNRIIFLTGDINQESIVKVITEMKYLEAIDPKKDIKLYLDSYGGEVAACLALCDFMRNLKCDVAVYALGTAMSAGAMILSSGTKGKRYVQYHTGVMIHPVQHIGCEFQRAFPDFKHDYEYSKTLNDIMMSLLAKNTGKNIDQIRYDADRDFYLFGEEAVEYGLADNVIGGW